MQRRHAIGTTVFALALALAGCGRYQTPIAAAAGQTVDGARHLGKPAIAVENFAKVNDTLYRGGLPSDQDMQGLAKLGIKTDVDLMGGGNDPIEQAAVAHEQQVAGQLGIKFVNIRIPFDVDLPLTMVDQWLGIALNASSQPVYVHCKHGRDRTGTMVAAYRIKHDGWTGQQALTEMESFGYDPKRFPFFTKFVLNYQPSSTGLALAP